MFNVQHRTSRNGLGQLRALIGEAQRTAEPIDINTNKARWAQIALERLAQEAGDEPAHISAKLASVTLSAHTFPGQRRINRVRVDDIAESIASGAWIPSASTVSFVRVADGGFYAVNGHHRLTAARDHAGIDTCIQFIDVPDMCAARRVYATFDQRQAARSRGQLIDSSHLYEDTGLRRAVTRAMYNAVPFVANGLRPIASALGSSGLRTHEARVAGVLAYRDEGAVVDAYIGNADRADKRLLLRAATLAVALYTLRFQRDKATDFWSRVADGDGLRRNDPRYTLRSDMRNRHIGAGVSTQGLLQSIVAWNAFFEGRSLVIIRCNEASPLAVAGTPIANRRAA